MLMMKLGIRIILSLTFASAATTAISAQQGNVKQLSEEDRLFWRYILEGNGSLSIPLIKLLTLPPTFPPTLPPNLPPTLPPTLPPILPHILPPTFPPILPPTFPPALPPTKSPTVKCIIELDLACVVAGDSLQAG
jgi:hypothetical protein